MISPSLSLLQDKFLSENLTDAARLVGVVLHMAVRVQQPKIARLVGATVDPLDDVVDVPTRRLCDLLRTHRTCPVLLMP